MSGNTVFAIISLSVLIAVGMGAAFIQFGLMLYVFGKWGFSWKETHVLFFLSDLFVLNPGLAWAWALAIIPSLYIAVSTISTSIARDRVAWSLYVKPPPYNLTIIAWIFTFIAQFGLILIANWDLHHPSGLHYVGVFLFGSAGVVLNFWVLYLDLGVKRSTWHPVYRIDCLLVLVSSIAVILFVFGSKSISAASEWCVLMLMVVLHFLLPIRGTRIVISRPQIWYNSRRSHIIHGGTLGIPESDDKIIVETRPAQRDAP